MSAIPRKVFIQVDSTEDQENIKNMRKTLKVLQKDASDKENLVGRHLNTSAEKSLHKKSKSETAVVTASSETEPRRRKSNQEIGEKSQLELTIDDLTTEGEPSSQYWKGVAEKRRVALNATLEENEKLHDKVESLEEELKIANAMLDESKNLVEILTEIIQENEANDSALPHNINGNLSHAMSTAESTSDEIDDDLDDEEPINVTVANDDDKDDKGADDLIN